MSQGRHARRAAAPAAPPSAPRPASPGPGRLTFLGAVRGELCKALSLRSTYVLASVDAVLLVVGAALMAWVSAFSASLDPATGGRIANPPDMPDAMLWSSVGSFVVTCLTVTGIFGVMAFTAECSGGLLSSSLTAVPRRATFLGAKATVTAAIAFLASLLGLLAAWPVCRMLYAGVAAASGAESRLPWVTLLGGAAVLALGALMGLGLGAVCRSTAGGVFALLGLVMIVPSALSVVSIAGDRFAWLQSVAACLPDRAAGTFLTGGLQIVAHGAAGTEGTPGVEVDVTVGASGADAASGAAAASGGHAGSPLVTWATQPMDSGVIDGVFVPSWWQAGLIVLAWAVALYAVGLLVLRRADVR
ncbi:hypothetical protein H7U32_08155 [Bifidobacterium pullorum subsp. saeculare]|uniref:ABC transporter permease n=1 Tax=Bifidobacterium pullorum subsp. saeculare TaxID=78257 RepID=A0A939BA61_9BIFI|nr:hypothetical protein [Bifidobacterium pullorum]MBM6700263.1 hypothetical protein [Bifidobacterium pullorum subsp. saeculare]